MKKFTLTDRNVRSASNVDVANLPNVQDAIGKLVDHFNYAEKQRHYIDEDTLAAWPDKYVYRHVDGRIFINYYKEVRNRKGKGTVRLLRWGIAINADTREEFYDENFDESSESYMPSLVEAQCRRHDLEYDDQRIAEYERSAISEALNS